MLYVVKEVTWAMKIMLELEEQVHVTLKMMAVAERKPLKQLLAEKLAVVARVGAKQHGLGAVLRVVEG